MGGLNQPIGFMPAGHWVVDGPTMGQKTSEVACILLAHSRSIGTRVAHGWTPWPIHPCAGQPSGGQRAGCGLKVVRPWEVHAEWPKLITEVVRQLGHKKPRPNGQNFLAEVVSYSAVDFSSRIAEIC